MILNLIILLLAIPIGLLIAWLANDELIDGFNYIYTLVLVSFIGVLIFSGKEVATLSLGFISIVAYISVLKRFDKKWAVQRRR